MPIRSIDPFTDPTAGLRSEVNPFLAKMQAAQAEGTLPLVFGPALKDFPGRWAERFCDKAGMAVPPRDVVVEIGSHKGDVLKQMALAHPETGFAGLDITFKRVVTTANKAVASGCSNLLSILSNAAPLDLLFGPEELAGLVIFFPDPWTKKRSQTKNQLVNSEFIKKAYRCLRQGGFFWFKTDQESYFETVSQLLPQAGLLPELPARGLPSETYTSRFEMHFQSLGQATFAGVWRKPQGG